MLPCLLDAEGNQYYQQLTLANSAKPLERVAANGQQLSYSNFNRCRTRGGWLPLVCRCKCPAGREPPDMPASSCELRVGCAGALHSATPFRRALSPCWRFLRPLGSHPRAPKARQAATAAPGFGPQTSCPAVARRWVWFNNGNALNGSSGPIHLALTAQDGETLQARLPNLGSQFAGVQFSGAAPAPRQVLPLARGKSIPAARMHCRIQ
jgi:hypothetical protein